MSPVGVTIVRREHAAMIVVSICAELMGRRAAL